MKAKTCPGCEAKLSGTAKLHCDSPTCNWSRCAECQAIFDRETGKFYHEE